MVSKITQPLAFLVVFGKYLEEFNFIWRVVFNMEIYILLLTFLSAPLVFLSYWDQLKKSRNLSSREVMLLAPYGASNVFTTRTMYLTCDIIPRTSNITSRVVYSINGQLKLIVLLVINSRNLNEIPMEIQLKFQWNTNGNINEIPIEIHWKSSWNFNEIPMEIHWKYQCKSIGNSFEILMNNQWKFQWNAKGNPVKIQ